MKTYKLDLKDVKNLNEFKLFRIISTKNFNDVNIGDKGGYIDKTSKLENNAWVSSGFVYNNSTVDNSIVENNSRVNNSTVNNSTVNNSRVANNSTVNNSTVNNSTVNNSTVANNSTVNNSRVANNSTVNNSTVNNSRVANNSTVNNSRVANNSTVNNSRVANNSRVDNSIVDNNSRVDNSIVENNSTVNNNSRVDNSTVNNSTVDNGLLKTDIKKYIALTCGFYPVNNIYYLFKRVRKISDGNYASCFDSRFLYKDGEIAEVADFDSDITIDCGKGIHISGMYYWTEGDVLIQVECHIEDVITCKSGKLRVKKIKVIGEVK
jgi:ADP-glucose pyrophosphorylase